MPVRKGAHLFYGNKQLRHQVVDAPTSTALKGKTLKKGSISIYSPIRSG